MKTLFNILTVAVLTAFIVGCEVEEPPQPNKDGDYTIIYNDKMESDIVYHVVYYKDDTAYYNQTPLKDTLVHHFEVEFTTNNGMVTKEVVDTVYESKRWTTEMYILIDEINENTPDSLKLTVIPKDTKNIRSGYINTTINFLINGW